MQVYFDCGVFVIGWAARVGMKMPPGVRRLGNLWGWGLLVGAEAVAGLAGGALDGVG